MSTSQRGLYLLTCMTPPQVKLVYQHLVTFQLSIYHSCTSRKQDSWVREQVKLNKSSDPFWKHTGFIVAQMDGLQAGVAQWAKKYGKKVLKNNHFQHFCAIKTQLLTKNNKKRIYKTHREGTVPKSKFSLCSYCLKIFIKVKIFIKETKNHLILLVHHIFFKFLFKKRKLQCKPHLLFDILPTTQFLTFIHFKPQFNSLFVSSFV